MRIWISTHGGLTVNFQPENKDEQTVLDKALGYEGDIEKPIGNQPFKKVGEGAMQVAHLGGHESQRWIVVDLNKAMMYPEK